MQTYLSAMPLHMRTCGRDNCSVPSYLETGVQMLVAAAVALHLMPEHGAGLAVGGGLQQHSSAPIAEQNTSACRTRPLIWS